jgi:DNA-binding MurR/RpiR family transcriptional regulator
MATSKLTLTKEIFKRRKSLTPKGRALSEFVIKNTRKAVFMTIRELAAACGVSEATVVRFAKQMGYRGYGEFIQALRELMDTELNLLDRVDLSESEGSGETHFRRLVYQEIDNLKLLYESLDIDLVNKVVALLNQSAQVYVIGSRLSYASAYFMGWSLAKIRSNVHILNGSDTTAIDHLTISPPDSLVVIIATSRYPNQLIKVGIWARRRGQTLVVITESSLCPIIQFAQIALVAPLKHIPFIGSPTPLSCLINYMVMELARLQGDKFKVHQEKLEQSFLENDTLFNLDKPDSGLSL